LKGTDVEAGTPVFELEAGVLELLVVDETPGLIAARVLLGAFSLHCVAATTTDQNACP
jgi:hypothetical protein